MLARLFLLFTITTLVEMVLLFELAKIMGLLPTVALVIVTGLLGAALARREWARAWHAIRAQIAAGTMPTDGLLDGLAVLIAGAFLLTPGVLTDVAGFALLIPAARRPLKSLIAVGAQRRIEEAVRGGRVHVVGSGFGQPFGGAGHGPGRVGPEDLFGTPTGQRAGGEIIDGELAEASGVFQDGDTIDVRSS